MMGSIADVPTPPQPPHMRWKVSEALVAELKKWQSDYYIAFINSLPDPSLGRGFLLGYGWIWRNKRY